MIAHPSFAVHSIPLPTIVRDDGDGKHWDVFVRACPTASFTHLAGWREIMANALGHETRYLIAVGGRGDWEGILPMVWVRSHLFGRYLVSMPFLNSGGPIGTGAARAALASAAVAEARQRGADLLELRSSEPCEGLATSHRKITVRLALPDTTDALWNAFPAKLRSQIRRPGKAGLTVQFGGHQREPFYEVYARHMRDLGSPALGRGVFETMARVFPDHMEFAVVYEGSRPVAAGCGFWWRAEFELVWAAALRSASALAPNMLLYWSLMQRAIDDGRRTFNFGRCTPGSGPHRFKQQWGGVDVPLPWAQWSPNTTAAPPTPDQRKFRAAVAVWRHLPPMVTRVCGPALARRIP